MGTMDPMMAFLRARLAEEQSSAEAASPGPWRVSAEGDEVLAVDGITVADGFALSGRQLRATTAHIARHDPARVLAEVEATRQTIVMYEAATDVVRNPPNLEARQAARVEQFVLTEVLRLRALAYTDHPDYDEAWRPATPVSSPE